MDASTGLSARDLAVLWHPCGQMRDYRDFPPLEVVGAHGCRLRLADGREILDAISSWWCKSLGHGHPRLRAALVAQAERFEHVILANTTNEPIVRLSERLCALANVASPATAGARRLGKVFYADNGSTAVEVALKLALQAHAQSGRAGRTGFAALANGYHGETVGALSVGDCGAYKDTFAPLLFPCVMLGPLPYRSGAADPRWQDASHEWPAIEGQLEAAADGLAAIIYEPILQGAGGMRVYSPDLLRRLRAWADAHGVYLIADEIAAGFGRCGAMLAGELAGVTPDIAVVSKGLTGGFLPLAAVITTDAVYDAFVSDQPGRAFLHSNTYAGSALAVAVANAVLDVFADEGVLAAVAASGLGLRGGLEDIARTRPQLRDVRGIGMVAAVDLRARDG
nr:adenosylmethionine--8-amino-7-oxononanoate transaminase [Planctomycetota bacterium]